MAVTVDQVAADLPFVIALRSGDLPVVRSVLAGDPGAANRALAVRGSRTRTPLHVVADWPGYYPNGPEVVRLLIMAGADPDGGVGDTRQETPLHWAASSDDLEVAVALLDGGADIEAQGASIAGGSPLDDAVGYGCWNVAYLLVRKGATVSRLWQASALGLQDRLEDLMTANPEPGPDVINEAFWQACHGGQRRTAEYLLGRGADPMFQPPYAAQSALVVAGSSGTRRDLLQGWLRAVSTNDRLPNAERDGDQAFDALCTVIDPNCC